MLNREREINNACAAIRGQNAADWLHHEQLRCIEKGNADIRRKKLIREKEDLRSRLVAALPPPSKPLPPSQSLHQRSVPQSHNSSRPCSSKRSSPFKKKMYVNNFQFVLRLVLDFIVILLV